MSKHWIVVADQSKARIFTVADPRGELLQLQQLDNPVGREPAQSLGSDRPGRSFAAPEEIPQPLIDQLAVGGHMVIPVGAEDEVQTLRQLVKEADGIMTVRNVIAVRFVPFTRDEAR